MNKWEYVAEAFRYDIEDIEIIKKREGMDPRTCCRGFFKDWLTSKRGAKVGPKVWSTLLDTLKEVDEIASGTVDDITTEINNIMV